MEAVITDDRNIVIELEDRKKITLFKNNFADYICTIRFKNILGRVIKEINMTELKVGVLIDNIYYFLETNQEVYCYIESTSINTPDCIISINLEECIIDGKQYWKDILSIYDYIDGNMIPRIKTDISNSKVDFIDKLYNLYIGPSSIENKLDYCPDFLK